MAGFALSSVPPFLDGVYLGVNAVSNAYLVIDCPSGCFGKCERIALNHDVTSTLFQPLGRHRIVQSGVDFAELSMGSERVLSQLVRKVVDEVRPEALVLTQATSALVTSNDLAAFCEQQSEAMGVPIVYLPPQTLEGDYLDGYAGFVEALVEAAAPDTREGGPDDVAIVGYFADRLEEDHRASLAELSRLLEALGLRPRGVLCGGGSVTELRAAMTAPTLLELPYGGGAARRIAERTGATVVPLPLPLGVGGTVDFVERVGDALGRAERAAKVVRAELAGVVSALDLARSRFLDGRSVAVAADPHLAAGLIGCLAELGLDVPLVAVHSRREKHLPAVRAAAGRAGLNPHIIHDVGPAALTDALSQAGAPEGVDVLIGASTDRDAASALGLGFVELGYPSFLTHAFFPRPVLGFSGARRLADDLVNAVQLADYDRNRGREPGGGETP